MDPWQRAIAFMRRIDERAAEQIVPFRWGRALVDRRFKQVHDANYLLADRLAGADAIGLIADAERIQGEAGLGHRRVNVDDQQVADRLRADFVSRGYQAERFVLMMRGRSTQAGSRNGVRAREVDWDAIRPARERQRLREPWATPELVRQILDRQRLIAAQVATRYFAVLEDGQAVSSCELRSADGAAQVEIVETLEAFRGHGYARAVVSAAVEAAKDTDFIFLVTDIDDWPQQLYRRLGFDDIGIETRFLRLLDG